MGELTIGSLCSGYGGLTLAVQRVLGGRVAWHSEFEAAPSKVLEQRFPGVPNLGDMTAVDWAQVERVDVIEGGTPCQDVSHAGGRGGMRAGTRSGLWSGMAMAIDVLRPRLVVWENVRGVASAEADSDVEPCAGCVGERPGGVLRALGRVLGDLAELGYDARWVGLRASDVGAPHSRFRYFVAAHPTGIGQEGGREAWGRRAGSADGGDVAAYAYGAGLEGGGTGVGPASALPEPAGCHPTPTDSDRYPVRDEPVAVAGGSGAAFIERNREAPTDSDRDGRSQLGRQQYGARHTDERRDPDTAWGPYEPAIRRWERVTGRVAPAPRVRGPRAGDQLNPEFSEWMMGLPAGWVTAVPGIGRQAKIKMLGNGVVPQQGGAALRYLLDGIGEGL